MKEQRCILLIDDKDQTDVADSIKLQLKNDFDLEFILIRTAASELKKEEEEDLDIEKLKAEIETKIKNKNIYIALTDFDLESDSINGLGVVRMTHQLRPKLNFLIYSGNWDEVIRTVVGKDYKQASIDELVGGINDLIHDNIVNCIGRTDYKADLIEYLKKNKGDTIEHRLSTLLRAHGEMEFESCFPEFKGMTFNEIADMIDCHSDARTDEWIEAVLTQTIAYLVKVNQ